MTAEELALYRELQPVFKEKMGKWRLGDMYWCPRQGEYGDNHYKVIIPDIDEDLQITSETTPCCPDVAIRIPDVYSRDPEKPERSLIGMCHHIACINPVTTIPEMTGEEEKIIEWKVTLNPGGGVVKQIYGDTLPLALLMALKWEVENGHK